MPKMQEVKTTKANATRKTKAAESANFYYDENGVKITVCKPGPAPKLLTARDR
jgi:hypothetical protein